MGPPRATLAPHLWCSTSHASTSRHARSFTVLWMATTLQGGGQQGSARACRQARTPGHVLLPRAPALAAHGVEEHLLGRVHPRAACQPAGASAATLLTSSAARAHAPEAPAWCCGSVSPMGMLERARAVGSGTLCAAPRRQRRGATAATGRRRATHRWLGACCCEACSIWFLLFTAPGAAQACGAACCAPSAGFAPRLGHHDMPAANRLARSTAEGGTSRHKTAHNN